MSLQEKVARAICEAEEPYEYVSAEGLNETRFYEYADQAQAAIDVMLYPASKDMKQIVKQLLMELYIEKGMTVEQARINAEVTAEEIMIEWLKQQRGDDEQTDN